MGKSILGRRTSEDEGLEASRKHRKNVAPASKRVKEDESTEVGRLRGVQACGLAEDSVHLFLSHVGGPLEDFSREAQ